MTTTEPETARAEILDADGEDITPRPPGPPGPEHLSSYDAMADADAAALEGHAAGREIERYRRPPVLPTVDEFAFIFDMAEKLARSQLVPSASRGKPADVAIILLAARDLSIPMTQAFAKLHVIDGRLTLSAEIMIALVLRDGHLIWCESLDGHQATACGQRNGSPYVARFTFTIDDASTAGLLGKDNWQNYPKAMLWARAVSGLVRMNFPDVTAGVTYTPDEIGDDERFTAHPASALDPTIREEFEARIAAMDEEQRQRLKLAWVGWGLNALSKLTQEEEQSARDLIDKAEAIDVDATESDGTDDDEPPEPDKPPLVTEPPAPTDPAIAQMVEDLEADVRRTGESYDATAAAVADQLDTSSNTLAELAPHADSVEDRPNVDGPEVFNGDTGHCAVCGAPIWYSVQAEPRGGWLHADELAFGPEHEVLAAGAELDADAIAEAWAAEHAPKPPTATEILAEVEAMDAIQVNQAARAAGLSLAGSPKTLKARYLEHRLAAARADEAR